MAFDEVRLPEDIERGAVGGPRFQTSIIALGTGSEQRNMDWSQQRCAFDISYGVDHKEAYAEVVKFFYARRGKAIGFRFKDWTDYQAVDSLIGVGDGSQTIFQLGKGYTFGGTMFSRRITRPVSGTVVIKVAGAVTAATINYSTGAVSFSSAPADEAPIQATFEFDVPVRFDDDELRLNARAWNVASVESINLVEIPE